MVVIGLGKNLLFKTVLAHCVPEGCSVQNLSAALNLEWVLLWAATVYNFYNSQHNVYLPAVKTQGHFGCASLSFNVYFLASVIWLYHSLAFSRFFWWIFHTIRNEIGKYLIKVMFFKNAPPEIFYNSCVHCSVSATTPHQLIQRRTQASKAKGHFWKGG